MVVMTYIDLAYDNGVAFTDREHSSAILNKGDLMSRSTAWRTWAMLNMMRVKVVSQSILTTILHYDSPIMMTILFPWRFNLMPCRHVPSVSQKMSSKSPAAKFSESKPIHPSPAKHFSATVVLRITWRPNWSATTNWHSKKRKALAAAVCCRVKGVEHFPEEPPAVQGRNGLSGCASEGRRAGFSRNEFVAISVWGIHGVFFILYVCM